MNSEAVPREFLGIVGQDPSDSKSDMQNYYVRFCEISRFCFQSFEV